jgi:hypothetical protein
MDLTSFWLASMQDMRERDEVSPQLRNSDRR